MPLARINKCDGGVPLFGGYAASINSLPDGLECSGLFAQDV
jgi:hypothetical protein